MKKKIFLHWASDGPSGGDYNTIEIDFGSLVEDSGSSEAGDEIEDALKIFGADIRDRFNADSFETERTLKALEAWYDEQAKKL